MANHNDWVYGLMDDANPVRTMQMVLDFLHSTPHPETVQVNESFVNTTLCILVRTVCHRSWDKFSVDVDGNLLKDATLLAAAREDAILKAGSFLLNIMGWCFEQLKTHYCDEVALTDKKEQNKQQAIDLSQDSNDMPPAMVRPSFVALYNVIFEIIQHQSSFHINYDYLMLRAPERLADMVATMKPSGFLSDNWKIRLFNLSPGDPNSDINPKIFGAYIIHHLASMNALEIVDKCLHVSEKSSDDFCKRFQLNWTLVIWSAFAMHPKLLLTCCQTWLESIKRMLDGLDTAQLKKLKKANIDHGASQLRKYVMITSLTSLNSALTDLGPTPSQGIDPNLKQRTQLSQSMSSWLQLIMQYDTLLCDLSLRFLDVPSLPSQVEAMNDFKKRIFDAMAAEKEKKEEVGLRESSALTKWVVENHLIERILAPEVHSQVLSRCDEILHLLTKTGHMTEAILNRFIEHAQDQHESVVVVVINALSRLVSFQSLEEANFVYQKLLEIPYGDWTVNLLPKLGWWVNGAMSQKTRWLNNLEKGQETYLLLGHNFGLELLWNMLVYCNTSKGALTPDISQVLLSHIKYLLSQKNEHGGEFRMHYFKTCLTALQQHKLVIPSLSLLTVIVKSMRASALATPLTNDMKAEETTMNDAVGEGEQKTPVESETEPPLLQESNPQNGENGVIDIDALLKHHRVVELIVTDMITASCANEVTSEETLVDELRSRLNCLLFLSQSLPIGEHLDRLWQILIQEAAGGDRVRNYMLQWFTSLIKVPEPALLPNQQGAAQPVVNEQPMKLSDAQVREVLNSKLPTLIASTYVMQTREDAPTVKDTMQSSSNMLKCLSGCLNRCIPNLTNPTLDSISHVRANEEKSLMLIFELAVLGLSESVRQDAAMMFHDLFHDASGLCIGEHELIDTCMHFCAHMNAIDLVKAFPTHYVQVLNSFTKLVDLCVPKLVEQPKTLFQTLPADPVQLFEMNHDGHFDSSSAASQTHVSPVVQSTPVAVNLTVHTVKNEEITVAVAAKRLTVGELRHAVAKSLDLPVQLIRLTIDRKELQDDATPLREANIFDGRSQLSRVVFVQKMGPNADEIYAKYLQDKFNPAARGSNGDDLGAINIAYDDEEDNVMNFEDVQTGAEYFINNRKNFNVMCDFLEMLFRHRHQSVSTEQYELNIKTSDSIASMLLAFAVPQDMLEIVSDVILSGKPMPLHEEGHDVGQQYSIEWTNPMHILSEFGERIDSIEEHMWFRGCYATRVLREALCARPTVEKAEGIVTSGIFAKLCDLFVSFQMQSYSEHHLVVSMLQNIIDIVTSVIFEPVYAQKTLQFEMKPPLVVDFVNVQPESAENASLLGLQILNINKWVSSLLKVGVFYSQYGGNNGALFVPSLPKLFHSILVLTNILSIAAENVHEDRDADIFESVLFKFKYALPSQRFDHPVMQHIFGRLEGDLATLWNEFILTALFSPCHYVRRQVREDMPVLCKKHAQGATMGDKKDSDGIASSFLNCTMEILIRALPVVTRDNVGVSDDYFAVLREITPFYYDCHAALCYSDQPQNHVSMPRFFRLNDLFMHCWASSETGIVNLPYKEMEHYVSPDIALVNLLHYLCVLITYAVPRGLLDKQLLGQEMLAYLLNVMLFPIDLEIAPKCRTARSRMLAFRLVQIILIRNPEMIAQLGPFLLDLSGKEKDYATLPFGYLPSNHERSPSGCGLVNHGSICYANATLQQLFMLPDFKERVIALPQSTPPVNDVLFQLQSLFCSLNFSDAKAVSPLSLLETLAVENQQAFQVFEQHDSNEFLNGLLDRLEENLKTRAKSGDNGDMTALAGLQSLVSQDMATGKVVYETICGECKRVSERTEKFHTLSLDVKGNSSIQLGLEKFTKEEYMKKDNKYYCNVCNKKVVAVRRTRLSRAMPRTLMLNLKRFEFNYDTMQKYKLNDECSFSELLDMSQFVQNSSVADNDPNKQEDGFFYRVAGVLVHSGTAGMGHYYSFIRQRSSNYREPAVWYKFNDQTVSHVAAWKEVTQSSFGGMYFNTYFDEKTRQHKGQWVWRTNNAYTLFYDRVSEEEYKHCRVVLRAEQSLVCSMLTDEARIAQDLLRRAITIPPVIKTSLLTNAFTHRMRRYQFSPHFLSFVNSYIRHVFDIIVDQKDAETYPEGWQFVTDVVQREIMPPLEQPNDQQSTPVEVHRVGVPFTQARFVSQLDLDSKSPNRAAIDQCIMAVFTYYFDVYIYSSNAHHVETDELDNLSKVMSNLLTFSPRACVIMLGMFNAGESFALRQSSVINTMLRCAHAGIRRVTRQLFFTALLTLSRDEDLPYRGGQKLACSAVGHFMEFYLSLLPLAVQTKSGLHNLDYFMLIRDFADRGGQRAREFLASCGLVRVYASLLQGISIGDEKYGGDPTLCSKQGIQNRVFRFDPNPACGHCIMEAIGYQDYAEYITYMQVPNWNMEEKSNILLWETLRIIITSIPESLCDELSVMEEYRKRAKLAEPVDVEVDEIMRLMLHDVDMSSTTDNTDQILFTCPLALYLLCADFEIYENGANVLLRLLCMASGMRTIQFVTALCNMITVGGPEQCAYTLKHCHNGYFSFTMSPALNFDLTNSIRVLHDLLFMQSLYGPMKTRYTRTLETLRCIWQFCAAAIGQDEDAFQAMVQMILDATAENELVSAVWMSLKTDWGSYLEAMIGEGRNAMKAIPM